RLPDGQDITSSRNHIVRESVASLTRSVLRDALGVAHLKDAWRQHCSQAQLDAFKSNSTAAAPNVTSGALRLDDNGNRLAELKSSPWNCAAISLLVKKLQVKAKEYAVQARMEDWNGVDWDEEVTSRIHAVLADMYRAKQPDFSKDVDSQMTLKYDKHLARSSRRRVRQWKFDTRLAVAHNMLRAARVLSELDQADAVSIAQIQLPTWEEAVIAMELLDVDGMSDEEDGRDGDEAVRLVYDVAFRSPRLRRFLLALDEAREAETAIFTTVGRRRRRRVYVEEMYDREPPTGLPSVFYRDGYLTQKGPLEARRLQVDHDSHTWRILEL
ncbi:hypothetical protein EV121DRAFT_274774, partial [Schizophyllum commune]